MHRRECPVFHEPLGSVLENAPSGDSIVHHDFSVHKSNNTWRSVTERNDLFSLNQDGALLLNRCAKHSLSIVKSMSEHLHLSSWHQDTLGCRLMIDFVIIHQICCHMSWTHSWAINWSPTGGGREKCWICLMYPKHIMWMCWEHLVEPPVSGILNDHFRQDLKGVSREAGDTEWISSNPLTCLL